MLLVMWEWERFFVYPTTTEEQKYYVYEDWKSEDLSHSEFLDSVFEPKGNKIVKSARVVEKMRMIVVYGVEALNILAENLLASLI